jgi:hypothetical protein
VAATRDVQDWLKGLAASSVDEGMQKLAPRNNAFIHMAKLNVRRYQHNATKYFVKFFKRFLQPPGSYFLDILRIKIPGKGISCVNRIHWDQSAD